MELVGGAAVADRSVGGVAVAVRPDVGAAVRPRVTAGLGNNATLGRTQSDRSGVLYIVGIV